MSKKLVKPLNVMIIDDDAPFVESLQRTANGSRVLLDRHQTLESGLLALRQNRERYYAGVILDVVCLKDEKQAVPADNFLAAAIREFHNNAPALTRVILTGDPGHFGNVKSMYQDEARVYFKDRQADVEEMFRYLVEESEKLPHMRLRKKYPEIFEIFDREYLDRDAETDLIKCLERMDIYDASVISENLGRLRKLQEGLFVQLNKLDPEIVPTHFIERKVERSDIRNHLKDKGYIEKDKIVHRSLDLVWRITSEYGAHTPNSTPMYPPTKYTVQMCTYAILDQLLWFKEMMDNGTSR